MLTDFNVGLLFLWLLSYLMGKLFLIRKQKRIIFKSKLCSFSEDRYLITNIWRLLVLYLGGGVGCLYLLNYLFRFLCTHGYLLYILWIIIQYCYDYYIFIAQTVPALAIGSSLKLASVSFQQDYDFFWTLLYFLTP